MLFGLTSGLRQHNLGVVYPIRKKRVEHVLAAAAPSMTTVVYALQGSKGVRIEELHLSLDLHFHESPLLISLTLKLNDCCRLPYITLDHDIDVSKKSPSLP